MKKHLAWIAFLALIVGIPFSTTLACGGGGSIPLATRVQEAEVVVEAVVVQADDVGQNVILRVEQYLKGGAGPEYLFLAGANPALIQRAYIDHNRTDDCIFGQQTLNLGDHFYAILDQYADGSYFQLGETAFGSDFYDFPTPESTVNVYVEGIESTIVTEAEFADLVSELSGETPSSSQQNSLYPATAPLIITTDEGKDYLLPLDGSAPSVISEDILREVVFARYMSHSAYSYWGERLYFALSECADIDCFTFAPGGLNTAFHPDNQRILLTWGWETELVGHDILFSPQAEAAVVWNENRLEVYLLRYAVSRLEPQDFEYNPELIATIPLVINASTLIGAYYAAWSPDARLLAYSDGNGLWLWDALANEEPHLLIPANGDVIPYAHYFSAQGRYLAIREDDRNYNLDLVSGEIFPGGTFSADERVLLALIHDETATDFYTFAIQQVVPPATYAPFIEGTLVREAVWFDNQWFAIVRCAPDEGLESCEFSQMNVNGDMLMGEDGALIYNGYDLTVQGEAFAAIVDDDTILFNGVELDLAVDGSIIAIRWLPSLFYDDPTN